MNWEAIGAIGEITGATAVVATLFYLAVQVRHSTTVDKTQNLQTVVDGLRAHFNEMFGPGTSIW